MKSSESKKDEEVGLASRRRFLKTVVAASGGAVAVGAAGSAIAADSGETEPERSAGKHGYSETQHVRDYYARARF